MATRTFYATRDLKNPSYGTRMLKAGDPVELDGPKSRLYLALGAVSREKPVSGRLVAEAPVVTETAGETLVAKPKAAPKRRAATTAKKRTTKKAK